MTAFLSSVDDWALWLAAVAGGLAALGWLGKKGRAGWKRVKAVLDKVEKMFALADQELRNNGGKTLKDRADRTAKAVDELTETVDGIRDTVDVVAEKVERVESVESKLDGHLLWSQAETERRVAEEQRLWTAIEALRPAPEDN